MVSAERKRPWYLVLALLGALGSALGSALGPGPDATAGAGRGPSGPDHREAALVTFLVTASQITALGLSAPFWGLAMAGLERLRR